MGLADNTMAHHPVPAFPLKGKEEERFRSYFFFGR